MLLFIVKMWISPKSLSEIRKKSLTYPQELHFYTLPSSFLSFVFLYFPRKANKKLRFFYFTIFQVLFFVFPVIF